MKFTFILLLLIPISSYAMLAKDRDQSYGSFYSEQLRIEAVTPVQREPESYPRHDRDESPGMAHAEQRRIDALPVNNYEPQPIELFDRDENTSTRYATELRLKSFE